jgi:hypothetical protein
MRARASGPAQAVLSGAPGKHPVGWSVYRETARLMRSWRTVPDGIIGIEVKSAQTVRPDDLRGLRYLKDKLGSRMHAGYILNCGDESFSFGDGIGNPSASDQRTTDPATNAPRTQRPTHHGNPR